MPQGNLIPRVGYVVDNNQDKLRMIPRAGYVPESPAAVSYVDLTTFTEENDTASQLSQTATRNTITGFNATTLARLGADYGIGYFSGSFQYDFDLYFSAFGTGDQIFPFILSKTNASAQDVYLLSGGALMVELVESTGLKIRFREVYSSSAVTSGTISLSTSTNYYCRFKLDTGASTYGDVTLYVYSNVARTTLVGSVSLSRNETINYRHAQAFNTWAVVGGMSITGYTENYTLPDVPIVVDVGLNTETDSAFAVVPERSYALTQALESNTSFGVTAVKTYSVGLTTETDIAQATTLTTAKVVGLSEETNNSFAVTRGRTYSVAQSIETDNGLSAAPGKLYDLGLPSDTNIALAITKVRSLSFGIGSETDEAFIVTTSGSVPVGFVSESDSAFDIAAEKMLNVGLSSETDTAFSIAKKRAYTTGLSSEIDSAFEIAINDAVIVGLVSEIDAALSISALRELSVDLALETDEALLTSLYVLSGRRNKAGNRVLLTDRLSNAVDVTSRKYNGANVTSRIHNQADIVN